MTDSLYQDAIMAHAKAAHGAGRLEQPDGTATVDNPLCGDRVTMDVALDDQGRIARLGHKVRGCVLCSAVASVLGDHADGLTAEELHRVGTAFEAMIREGEPVPEEWPDLSAFEPVRAAKSRHECVLLPFEALEQAVKDAAGA
jgi:nitrogen fixation NifU-like protein